MDICNNYDINLFLKGDIWYALAFKKNTKQEAGLGMATSIKEALENVAVCINSMREVLGSTSSPLTT